MTKIETLPTPQGWYCLSPSHQLPNGAVKPVTFAGQEYVLYRTESGEAAALGAYCPHLGAHMGHGGHVCGDDIVCPFHHFRFDTDGACTGTGYGTPAPERARAEPLLLHEVNGLVLAWYDPNGEEPKWRIPQFDSEGWALPSFKLMDIASHPQETSENSVDIGHLSIVHGYGEVVETQPVEIKGQVLRTRYQMRRANFFGVGPDELLVNFEASVHGLGVSVVNIDVQPFGFAMRLFILPTPTSPGQLALRAGIAVHDVKHLRFLPAFGPFRPQQWLERIIQELTLRGVAHDVSQDFAIWENKTYVREPALARGDGPIGRYRRWCRQFYPAAPDHDATAPAEAAE